MLNDVDLVVCDLDGTLCDIKHRQHLAQVGAWEEFHAGIPGDAPRTAVLSLLKAIAANESPALIFCTGRPAAHFAATKAWLEDVCDLYEVDDYCEILMRGDHDFGSDVDVKLQLLKNYLSQFYSGSGLEEQDYIKRVLILEDRDKVVAAMRDAGYEVWQVNEGCY